MNSILMAPFLFFLAPAIILLVIPKAKNVQAGVALLGGLLAVVSSIFIFKQVIETGTIIMNAGNWPPPFGITFVADRLSAVMVLISNLLGLICLVYSWHEVDAEKVRIGLYPLMLVLLAGVNGAFLTGDIFNLYVWFEVLLISSFSLLTLGSSRAQIKGALPYVAINLLSSCLFLTGIGALYGLTGTLNMAELSLRMANFPSESIVLSVATLFLIAFGIKAAVFPLFFWLPVSYHTPPVTVSAIFAGLLTKVAVYGLIRIFTLIFIKDMGPVHTMLLWVAGFTMVTGVLGAACQSEIRKILSFHIISQIGYMIMGLAFFTPLALAGTLLFIVHNILVKSNLFLISGAIFSVTGTFELKEHGGLYRSHPYLSILFLSSCFSLAGLPPLSGFWGKLILAAAGLEIQQYLLVGISLAVGLLTLFSMTKIWMQSFWKPAPVKKLPASDIQGFLFPITCLSLLALLPALYPEPFIEFFRASGEELMNPSAYTEAVLGKSRSP